MESGSGQLEFINSYSMISSWCNLPYILQYPKLYGWFHVGTYNRPCWRFRTHFNFVLLVSGKILGKFLHIEQVQRDPLELWRDPDHTEGRPHRSTLSGENSRHQDSGGSRKRPIPSTFDILCSECPARRMEGCRAGPRNGTCWFRVLNKCWWIFSLQFIIRPTTFRVLICSFQWEAAPWAKLWDWPRRCHCTWGEYFQCNTNQLKSCFVDMIFRSMGLWSRTIGGTLWTTLP